MTAAPAHRAQQDGMQPRERHIFGYQDAPPDERLDVLELDAQLVLERGELCYAACDSARGSRGARRHGSSSSMRLIGWLAMYSSTCRRYRCGSSPFKRQLPIRL